MARGKDARAARLLIDRILDRGDVKVVVAHSINDEEVIRGWLCFTRIVGERLTDKHRTVVHYAYTREPERRKHVLLDMLTHERIEPRGMLYTFAGPMTKKLERNLLAHATRVSPMSFLGDA